MKKKLKKRNKEKKIKLEWKYVFLSLLAGALYYVAYLIKVPNSYSILVSLTLVSFLFMNFSDLKGVSIIIYSMIIAAMLLPKTIWLMPFNILAKIGILGINLFLIFVIIYGLVNLKRWAAVLSILTSLISTYQLVYAAIFVLKATTFNIYVLLFIIRNFISLMLLFMIIVYLLTFWKKFK